MGALNYNQYVDFATKFKETYEKNEAISKLEKKVTTYGVN